MSKKNNILKILAPTWNKEFQLSYFVSNIQDCSKYIIKKHEAMSDNPPIRIYVNKIENRITFRMKASYYL